MRHHAGPFAAVLATAALVSALGAAIVGYLDQRAVEGARLALEELSGADLGLQVSLTRADDPEKQDREVIDYTPRDNVAERLAKRFGAAMGESAARAVASLTRLR